MSDRPTLPSYDGACITNVVPALLHPPDAAPPGCRRPRSTPTASCCSSSTGSAGSSCRTAPRAHAGPRRPRRWTDHHGRAVHHGDRAHVDHHRAAAGGARRRRLPDGRARRGAQRPAVEHRRGRRPPEHPAAEGPDPRLPSAASARRRSPAPSSSTRGSRSAHLDQVRFTGYRTLGTLTAEIVRLATAGEPFVYAYYEGLDKVSHEYGLGEQYDEELRWIDHLVGDAPRSAPGGHGARRHRGPRAGRGRRRRARAARATSSPTSRCSRARAASAGSTPARAAPPRCSTPPRELLGEHAWVRSRADGDRGGLVRPDGHRRRRRAASATCCSRPRAPCAFHDPNDTGPYVLVGRHGSLTDDEMLVPLLVGVAG